MVPYGLYTYLCTTCQLPLTRPTTAVVFQLASCRKYSLLFGWITPLLYVSCKTAALMYAALQTVWLVTLLLAVPLVRTSICRQLAS